MNLFQIKTKPHNNNVDRLKQFLDEDFVCIGWPGIGDLNGVSKDEIRNRIAEEYGYSGHKLGNNLGHVNAFVNTMKSGDYVFISDNEYAYIGIVGDYFYEQNYDNDIEGICHRRSVRWLEKVKISELNIDLQNLLKNRNTVSQYPSTFDEKDLNNILNKKQPLKAENLEKVDSLLTEALMILEDELKSEDPDRRLKAAIELLRLKNN